MTLPQVQVLLQSVSSLAIAASVVFAAIQLKNWRKAMYVSNFTKMVELQNQLRKIRVDAPELASVHKHDVEELSSPRAVQDYFLNLMQLALFEIAWFSHRQGQLPDDYFQSLVGKMRAIFTEESFQKMISTTGMKVLHDEFQAYVKELMRTTPGVRIPAGPMMGAAGAAPVATAPMAVAPMSAVGTAANTV